MNWELEFERCRDRRWLAHTPEVGYLVTKELNVALDDLAEAESGYQRGGYKWSIVQSYYAMFHAARALLYSRGYREKSHYCLSIAMRHLFVGQGVLDERLINDMDDARALREDADHRAEFSAAGARHNLTAAKCLIARTSELLADWEEPPGDQPIADSTLTG